MIDEEISIETTARGKPPEPKKASGLEIGITYIIALSILLADLATKLVIERNLEINQSYVPIEAIEAIFKITYVSNTGAAFGLFPTGSKVIMVVAVIVSLVIIIYNQKLPAHHSLFRVALGLQLGGALGNFLSRVRIGHVTDFLDFGPWPVSNIADISIVVGTILLGILMIFEKEERPAADDSDISFETPESQESEAGEESPVIWNE
ncbi:MAG TPA: signal peptidase II [candidate division Zixibacteria bacterium]|nr:signal peptidase II [candidate division Zixibacteria bacterium]